MKLSNFKKDKIRKLIEEKIKEVPVGSRIKIDKDLLEDLLFDIKNSNFGQKAKFITWTGSFLSKIDLSEVNFDNVVWDLNYCVYHKKEFAVNNYENVKELNFENTNVNIDFSKSYEHQNMKNCDDFSITHCNFRNVDMSNSHIENIPYIYYCDLKNSKIKFKNNEIVFLYRNNLEGNDLSELNIDISCFYRRFTGSGIVECNVKNTKLNLNYNYSRPDNYYKKLNRYYDLQYIDFKTDEQENEYSILAKEIKPYIDLDILGKKLGKSIKNGELEGCYINGKLIKNNMQKRIDRTILIDKLNNTKDIIIKNLDRSLNNQIKLIKEKV